MASESDPANFDDSFVEAGGIETHYWDVGPEDGQPIVMVHGGGAGADAWGNYKFAMPRLADRGFHVYAIDMVGFGKSATPSPETFEYTNQARIDQLADFITAMDIDRPSLIGNSMGGSASTGVAIQQPDLIDGLILVGGAGYRRSEEEEAQRERPDALDALTSFEGSREGMYDIINVLSVKDWYDRDKMVDHRLRNYEREGVQEALSETMRIAVTDDMSYADEEWASIEVETLLIYGRNDVLMGPIIPWGIFNLIEESSLHILNNCGHWVMVDQMEQSTGLVAEFLQHA